MIKGSPQYTSPTPCIQASVLALNHFLDELLPLQTQKYAYAHTHPHVLSEAAFESGFHLDKVGALKEKLPSEENGVCFSEKSLTSSQICLSGYLYPSAIRVDGNLECSTENSIEPSQHNPLHLCGNSVSALVGPPRSHWPHGAFQGLPPFSTVSPVKL